MSLMPVLSVLLAEPASAAGAKDGCNLIETHWREVPMSTVKQVERVSIAFAGQTYIGCRVELKGWMASQEERESWPMLPDAARSAHPKSFTDGMGWRNDLSRDADGPRGTQFVLRKGSAFCVVNGSWDGGDDSDRMYVPSNGYLYSAECADKSARLRR